jgi:hypothetical protein
MVVVMVMAMIMVMLVVMVMVTVMVMVGGALIVYGKLSHDQEPSIGNSIRKSPDREVFGGGPTPQFY